MARHVKKGDTVMITAGAHKGKIGEIMRVITDKDKVVIKGINLRTKHLKPTRINPQGGIITKEAPVHISNVSPAVDGRPTRVRFEVRTRSEYLDFLPTLREHTRAYLERAADKGP
jgi:large subunit ribosomal protein L24